jgi:TolB protein
MRERPVAPSIVRDTVPPGVEAAVLTALAKLPADRFSQASDFTRALADFPAVVSGARPAVVQLVPRRTPAALGIAAVAVALIALAVVTLLRRGPAPLIMGAVTQVTRSTDTLNFDAAISPDGQFVAYAAGTAGRMRLFVRQVSGSAPVLIATGLSEDHRWPRWSPDGSRLAFMANKAIHVIPALGGVPQLLVSLGDIGGQPSWSPDGTHVAYADSAGISVVAVTGGTPRRVIHTLEAHSPSWSPDGRRIAYAVENLVFTGSIGYGNAAPSSVWTASATGGDSAFVTDAERLNTGPVWWPDGHSILFVSDRDGARDVYRQTVNPRGRPQGKPDRVTSGLNVFSFTLTRDGSQMAYSTLQLRANIWMAPITANGTTPSSAAHPVTTEKQSIEGIALSHDGKWLAYDSNRNGNLDIFKVAFNGAGTDGDAVALTTDSAPDFEPRWSPSDNELVFYSRRLGDRDLFTVQADGRGERRITDLPGNEYYPDWSPDGRRIVFSSQVSYGWDVFVMTRDAEAAWSAPRRVSSTAMATVNVRWSPDGRSFALVSDSTLCLLPVDGGALRPLVDGRGLREFITFVAWGRDPSRVYFQTRDSTGIYSFWSASTTGDPPRRLIRLAEPGRRTRRPEFDTDGKNLFFTVVDDEADVAVVSLKRP